MPYENKYLKLSPEEKSIASDAKKELPNPIMYRSQTYSQFMVTGIEVGERKGWNVHFKRSWNPTNGQFYWKFDKIERVEDK